MQRLRNLPSSKRACCVLFKLRAALCTILLCLSPALLAPALLAQSDAAASGVDILAAKTLGPIDYVEIDKASEFGRDKQLIIFVHGTPGSYTTFRSYLDDPVMQARFHMISVTRPGWRHDDDPKIASLEQQAAALTPLLDMDRSGKGAILMGHSYGGPVIARTAMNYPDKVAGLAFVATTADPQLSGPRWYNRIAVVLPRFILGARLKGANAEILPLKPQLEEMLPLWEHVSVPVLIVQGDEDRLVHPGNALFMRDMLLNADVRFLQREGLGHFVLWQESELIRDKLVALFASDSDGAEAISTSAN
ncbi:MAG: alpha/beta hydrolase [Pseudohongiellaceae bacterium]